MEGEWSVNDEATSAIRETLPEPKQPSGFLSGLGGASVSVGIPGVPGSVPVGGSDEKDKDPARSMHSYGRVVMIEIREGPNLFGVDYGFGRGFMYTLNETTLSEVDDRQITTTASRRGDRYVVRKTADAGRA